MRNSEKLIAFSCFFFAAIFTFYLMTPLNSSRKPVLTGPTARASQIVKNDQEDTEEYREDIQSDEQNSWRQKWHSRKRNHISRDEQNSESSPPSLFEDEDNSTQEESLPLSEDEKKKIKALVYEKYAQYFTRGESIVQRIEQYQEIISQAADFADLDPDLLAGLMAVESAGKNGAVSSVGATGLMQIYDVPADCKEITKEYLQVNELNLSNPKHNIFLGAITLDYYINLKNNNLLLGLISYNAGPGYTGIENARNYMEALPNIKNGIKDFPIMVLAFTLMVKSQNEYGKILPYNDEPCTVDIFDEAETNRQAIERLYVPGLED